MAQRTLSRTVPALLPTPSANDATGAESETRERRQEDGTTGGPSLRDLPKLLPTPTSAVDSGSRNLEGSKAHAGVSLTDVFATGGSTEPRRRLLPSPTTRDHHAQGADHNEESRSSSLSTVVQKKDEVRLLPTPTAEDSERGRAGAGTDRLGAATFDDEVRLLPTPQAADGDGGRQEKGAMSNSGVRPSGHKATLPLPTAVAMRDELTETPFTAADDGGQLVLLPTPVANADNPGAGGELRAALVHGEGRRNETGVDTFGRPNAGRPPRMLPTPAATDGKGSDLATREGQASLRELDRLLPTPETVNRKSRKAMTSSTDNGRRSGGGNSSPPALEQIAEIREGRWPRDLPPYEELPPATRAIIDSFLAGIAEPMVEWGVYEGAVRRWEAVLGRPAPAPTDEKGRLDPPFVEWMLGYPDGHFDVDGVSRTRKLRALGNSVQVQCGEAVGHWLAALLESGVLLEETAA